MTSHQIYPLAQRLYAEIPAELRRWGSEPTDATTHDQVADNLLSACDTFGVDVGGEDHRAAVVISEALAGFVTGWGCRYEDVTDDVRQAQAALVAALGGVVQESGFLQLTAGTPITEAAIAQLIGWVTMLDIPEASAS